MKKILILLCICCVIGCSKDDGNDTQADELGPVGGDLLPGGVTSDGVSSWQSETEIVFTDYYSLIDTVIAERKIIRDISYYCDENENVTVTWSVNGNTQSDFYLTKAWRDDLQKWLIKNTATLNVQGIDKNLKIEAIVKFPDKSVRRAKTIPTITTKKEVSDAFGFTFGTNRTDMNDIIANDLSPNFAYCGDLRGVTQDNPISHIEFNNGKLIRLYLLVEQDSWWLSVVIYLANKCRIPAQLELTGRIIQNPQEWTSGKLKLKADTKNFSDLGLSYEYSYISIEKEN